MSESTSLVLPKILWIRLKTLQRLIAVTTLACHPSYGYGQTHLDGDRSYGSRININPDTALTADFIDRDGDGIDDRHQIAPFVAPEIRYPIGLPKIKSININTPLGIPTLREGISLYEEYTDLRQLKSSKLKPKKPLSNSSLDNLINAGRVSAIVFDFPSSIRIIKLINEKLIAIGNTGRASYEYYELSDTKD